MRKTSPPNSRTSRKRGKPSELTRATRLATRLLAEILEAARSLPSAKKTQGTVEVSLRLVGPSLMRQLNSSYRGKDTATDVLSFPAPQVFAKLGVLGELVICLSTARRQAGEFGHSLKQELEVLLVHGYLHLLGWDHERSALQASRMQSAEKKLLERAFGRKAGGLIRRSLGKAQRP